jgi:hypothetical protein
LSRSEIGSSGIDSSPDSQSLECKDVNGQSSGPENETTVKHNDPVFENASHGAGLDPDRWLSRSEFLSVFVTTRLRRPSGHDTGNREFSGVNTDDITLEEETPRAQALAMRAGVKKAAKKKAGRKPGPKKKAAKKAAPKKAAAKKAGRKAGPKKKAAAKKAGRKAAPKKAGRKGAKKAAPKKAAAKKAGRKAGVKKAAKKAAPKKKAARKARKKAAPAMSAPMASESASS